MTSVIDSGDRAWLFAGEEKVASLAKKVAKRAKAIHGDPGEDAIHDMRTATRRLRTAIELYGEDGSDGERDAVDRELKRVTRRLGDVRDLDVLLKSLDDDPHAGRGRHDLSRLSKIWKDERRTNAERLAHELRRRRFHRALRRAGSVVRPGKTPTGTIAARAPALIWEHFGRLVAYDVDPTSADPDQIHEVRIAAKKLRYTLEAFEDALEPGRSLIDEVTAFQDAAGDMHDAIVAGERARAIIAHDHRHRRQRSAINAFADDQDVRAQRQRRQIRTRLRAIRSRKFRNALGRAVAGMGHIANQ